MPLKELTTSIIRKFAVNSKCFERKLLIQNYCADRWNIMYVKYFNVLYAIYNQCFYVHHNYRRRNDPCMYLYFFAFLPFSILPSPLSAFTVRAKCMYIYVYIYMYMKSNMPRVQNILAVYNVGTESNQIYFSL